MDTDLFVVGGGPAGLAAALAARKRGFQVVVADRARPPIDKACGEGLMPDGVAALREIGVELTAADGVPFRGIRFLDGDLPGRGPLFKLRVRFWHPQDTAAPDPCTRRVNRPGRTCGGNLRWKPSKMEA